MSYNKDMNNIKGDIGLLFEIGCFRYLQRTWKRFFNPVRKLEEKIGERISILPSD